jgi:hypothetical protein
MTRATLVIKEKTQWPYIRQHQTAIPLKSVWMTIFSSAFI